MKYVFLFLAACGGAKACPDPANPPSYASAIAPMMERSCTPCHSASVRGANRNEAPREVNYDTHEEVAEDAALIIRRLNHAGVDQMPPASASQERFSAAEIKSFEQWNACGAHP